MSDLQDLIAKNAVMAYNQGFERGEASERERIIKLLEGALNYSEIDLVLFWDDKLGGTQVTKEGLIALIKGEQK